MKKWFKRFRILVLVTVTCTPVVGIVIILYFMEDDLKGIFKWKGHAKELNDEYVLCGVVWLLINWSVSAIFL